jgi:hypothetical protein
MAEASGIVRPSASRTSLLPIRADGVRATAANSGADRRNTGTVVPNIFAATSAPTVSTASSSRNTSAAGARPFSAMSSRTPEPEQEPRLVGITSTAPASETPCSGWRASMTRAVVGSTSPQKLSDSSLASTGPSATPCRTKWHVIARAFPRDLRRRAMVQARRRVKPARFEWCRNQDICNKRSPLM